MIRDGRHHVVDTKPLMQGQCPGAKRTPRPSGPPEFAQHALLTTLLQVIGGYAATHPRPSVTLRAIPSLARVGLHLHHQRAVRHLVARRQVAVGQPWLDPVHARRAVLTSLKVCALVRALK